MPARPGGLGAVFFAHVSDIREQEKRRHTTDPQEVKVKYKPKGCSLGEPRKQHSYYQVSISTRF